jgi:hypothetical protein
MKTPAYNPPVEEDEERTIGALLAPDYARSHDLRVGDRGAAIPDLDWEGGEGVLADRPRENLMNANRTLTQCAESAARKQTAQMRCSVNHQTRLP